MRVFVDTNVLVYAHDADAPEKRAVALDVLERNAQELVLSTQVLAEFYVVVTRKLARPLSPEDAAAQVDDLAEATVVPVDADLVRSAVSLSRSAQLALWDAMVLKSAERGGCEMVLTEDLQDGFRLGDLEVRNPFAPSPG